MPSEQEWVNHYQTQAQLWGRHLPHAELRARLCENAMESIDECIRDLQETKEYELTIRAGAFVSGIPLPGSHILSKKLVTDSAVVAYARKVLTELGLADASAVGKLFKEALSVTNKLPETSTWFALIATEAQDYLNQKEISDLKHQLTGLWDQSTINGMVDEEIAQILGPTAVHEAQDLVHHMHLFGPIIKAMRGAKNAKERLDKAATIMRDRALATHQKVFVEVAIKRAMSEPPAQAEAREQRLAKIQQFIEFINFGQEHLLMGADIGAVTCYVDVPKFDGFTTFCHNCFKTIGIGRFYRCLNCHMPNGFDENNEDGFHICQECYDKPGVNCNGVGHRSSWERMDMFDPHGGCSVILNPPAPGVIMPCSLCKFENNAVYLHCCKCNDSFNMCVQCANSMKTCREDHVLKLCVRYPTWFPGDDD